MTIDGDVRDIIVTIDGARKTPYGDRTDFADGVAWSIGDHRDVGASAAVKLSARTADTLAGFVLTDDDGDPILRNDGEQIVVPVMRQDRDRSRTPRKAERRNVGSVDLPISGARVPVTIAPVVVDNETYATLRFYLAFEKPGSASGLLDF